MGHYFMYTQYLLINWENQVKMLPTYSRLISSKMCPYISTNFNLKPVFWSVKAAKASICVPGDMVAQDEANEGRQQCTVSIHRLHFLCTYSPHSENEVNLNLSTIYILFYILYSCNLWSAVGMHIYTVCPWTPPWQEWSRFLTNSTVCSRSLDPFY